MNYLNLIDLALIRNGAEIISFSNDFLGQAENLLKSEPINYDENLYDENGKIYDGWGSKRSRNIDNEDWVIIKLGNIGKINLINIDTTFFSNNSPMFVSLEGVLLDKEEIFEEDNIKWQTILKPVNVQPDKQNIFFIEENKSINYVRLRIYPDGGISRLRLFGVPDLIESEESLDYASIINGGKVILSSDTYYGHMNNLIKPHVPLNSNDGWGTMRRRNDGNDWIIVKLGKTINLEEILINTQHFIGNFPEFCKVESLNDIKLTDLEVFKTKKWQLLRDDYKMFAGHEHRITKFEHNDQVSHIKISIYPDGGISRVKIIGKHIN